MEHFRTIGIIGAGLSGLVTAKTCLDYGFNIKVFEKDKDLGGVWAPSRRYPGLMTQNTKDTYCFTDLPMPKHFAEWPSGGDMQTYLTSYAKKFNVFPHINFSHEVAGIEYVNGAWIIAGKNNGIPFSEQVDFLIVCNGTFSDPFIPEIAGLETFTQAGGKIYHSTKFNSTELSKDKRVVIVGYNKSALDIAVAASNTAQSTHMIIREVKWKIPRFVNGINAKYIFLNRLGEALIKPRQHNTLERFIHKIGLPDRMLSFMEKHLTKKQKLKETGLLPNTKLKDLCFSEISLEAEGFFDKVLHGNIIPKQTEIASVQNKKVTLNNGETIEADVIIFATGFRQSMPFMPAHYDKNLIDEHGNYILYRHILPAGIPSLAFVGYNSSLYCNLTSEFAALWVCEYLKGRIAKPNDKQILEQNREYTKWRSQFRMKGYSRGLSVGPESIYHVDVLLNDMKVKLPLYSLIPDWLILTDPLRYNKLRKKILKRNNASKVSIPQEEKVEV